MDTMLAMDLLNQPWLGTPVWLWLGFMTLVTALLALDLGLLNRGGKEIGVRKSLLLSAGYVSFGLAFGLLVWHTRGAESALAYVTGFAIEKSLSLDNVFVIAMIFGALGIPRAYQHRVLFWGVMGVIVLRGIMIGLGTALVTQFAWLLPIFGAFLVWTGYKMWREASHHAGAVEAQAEMAQHPLMRWLRRHLRVTPTLHGHAFFVHQPDAQGRLQRWVTPLFLALCMVELIDLVFAIDSVPAVLAVSQDPFIVYTSNIFAILGLRALYFALAAMVERFSYLKYALALLLVFVGAKILAGPFIGHLPTALSLGITVSLLAGGVAVSMWKTRGQPTPPLNA